MHFTHNVKNILIEIINDGDNALNSSQPNNVQLPSLSTPIHQVFPDSMAVLTALLALEEKTGGDLTRIGTDAPPPQTFKDFILLGSIMSPSFFQEDKE